jgi:hypothetical protein
VSPIIVGPWPVAGFGKNEAGSFQYAKKTALICSIPFSRTGDANDWRGLAKPASPANIKTATPLSTSQTIIAHRGHAMKKTRYLQLIRRFALATSLSVTPGFVSAAYAEFYSWIFDTDGRGEVDVRGC